MVSGRWVCVFAVGSLLAACALPEEKADPSRLGFGVSVSSAAAPTGAETAGQVAGVLDWKTAQICTTGAESGRQEPLAAEENQQIIDRDLRCRPYSFSIFPISFSSMF